MAKVYIGTSGWLYPHWQGVFYPQGLAQNKWLEFYGKNFATVEVNSSFYHSMRREVYKGWAKKTPDNFIFSIKGSRFITHIKILLNCGEPIKRLLEQTDGLSQKLGSILLQLPPRWKADKERLEAFLQELRAQNSKIRVTFEFRDQSWLSDEIFKILKKYRVALCIQNSPNWPTKEEVTAGFVYLRFHGSRSLYASEYSKKELESWAKKIKKWQKLGLDVFTYFNNDAHGFAIKNAKELGTLLNN